MNKNLRVVLLAALPLLAVAVVLAIVFLTGNGQEPATDEPGAPAENQAETETGQSAGDIETGQSPVIDEVVDKAAAECGDYTAVERYGLVYAICEKDGLRFRIDDVSGASASQITRLKAAMEFRCSSLEQDRLRLNNLLTDEVIISAYLVADREDYPDLRLLQVSLNEAEYETRLVDACKSYDPDLASVQPASYEGTELAAAIEALSGVGASDCATMSIAFGQFGYESVVCGNDDESEADDFVVLSFAGAEQVALDALADSLEFSVCDGDAVGKLIEISGQLYVLGEDFDRLSETYRDLIELDGYQTAELVDTCDFQ